MTDRKVGELLVSLKDAGDDSAYYWQQKCSELIHKLVDERAERYSIEDCGKDRSWWGDVFPESYTNYALQDFSISVNQFNA
jgi:hypothetical protein